MLLEIEGGIYAEWQQYSKTWTYTFLSGKYNEAYEAHRRQMGYQRVCDYTLVFQVNEKALIAGQVNLLRQNLEQVDLAAAKKKAEINETIQQFLALEHEPPAPKSTKPTLYPNSDPDFDEDIPF